MIKTTRSSDDTSSGYLGGLIPAILAAVSAIVFAILGWCFSRNLPENSRRRNVTIAISILCVAVIVIGVCSGAIPN